jgi:hypothetical protein
MSDHDPLIVRVDMVQQLGSRPFCFENSWLQHAEFTVKVREIWNRKVCVKSVIDTWCIKLDRVKNSLRGGVKVLKATQESTETF